MAVVLACYVAICVLAFWFVGWSPGYAPMAEMAYGLNLLFFFAVVSIFSLVVFVALLLRKAGLREYLIFMAAFGSWIAFVSYKLVDEIYAAFIPRGHYYAISYKNESKSDIFVDGVGELRKGKDSGTRVVHRLPDKIVWWNGSSWREAVESDRVFLVKAPDGLQFQDAVVFLYQKDETWKALIELHARIVKQKGG